MFEIMARGDNGGELVTLSASSADEKRRWMEGISSYTRTEIRPSGNFPLLLNEVFTLYYRDSFQICGI